ncbi:MAG: alanine--tRNA ligase, partial [Ignavibacteriales bacterium]|nr:alanine--tRNA ligase [Ignavibacteriales bacterium]
GETGPCGPCSEIHIDRTPNGTATASMVNAGVPEVMEIWNLVFIQYNRDANGLTPLPAKHVDTGMGFERICAVLQNKSSNYDTDVFTPVITSIANVTDKKYSGTLSTDSPGPRSDIDIAFRVIADHVRMLSFALADGATPGPTDRGSVIRTVLNRAARFGRVLNMHEPFIYKIVDSVVESMGEAFPELLEKKDYIKLIIQREENRFNETQKNGYDYFYSNIIGEPIRQEYIRQNKIGKFWWVDALTSGENTLVFLDPSWSKRITVHIGQTLEELGINSITGEDAFEMHATYGIHIDDTEMLAKLIGLKVDRIKYAELMREHRERSKSFEFIGSGGEIQGGSAIVQFVPGKASIQEFAKDISKKDLKFVGYDELETTATLVKGDRHLLVLDTTPFYGEAGGQVGDKGTIEVGKYKLNVYDTQKVGSLNVHILEEPAPAILGEKVLAKVNTERRLSIMRNHTATHLVHAALRKILGTHVHQSGSLVAPDHLRFDFAHFSKVTEQELADIEALVNDKIKENITLNHHRNIPFAEAKKMGALMFFGDKYGDHVNVVEFSEFSKEFCGGTHVKSTAEIGYFKFRSEGSVASGIRRIEAVTSDGALELLKLQDRNLFERIDYALEQLHHIAELNKELATQSGNKAPSSESFKSFEQRVEALKNFPKQSGSSLSELKTQFHERTQRALQIENVILELAEKKKTLEKELSKYRLQSLSGNIDQLIQKAVSFNGTKLVSAKVSVGSMDELKSLGDTLRSKLGSGVGLLASVIDEKVALVCTVSDDLIKTKNIQAGKIVGAVAKLVGGGGGGKPHLATAGGKDVAKLDEALQSTEAIVKSFLTL